MIVPVVAAPGQLGFAPGTDRLRGVWVGSSWLAARAQILRVAGNADLVAAVVEIEQERQ